MRDSTQRSGRAPACALRHGKPILCRLRIGAACVDQIGSFASQTFGGGLRFSITSRQDISPYVSYQKRSQERTDTNFGLSYGLGF